MSRVRYHADLVTDFEVAGPPLRSRGCYVKVGQSLLGFSSACAGRVGHPAVKVPDQPPSSLRKGNAFAFVDYRYWRTQRMAVIVEEL